MSKYLLLPSFALATPFVTFSNLLKNMTFDKVDTNDHNNQLVIDSWSDNYCQDYVYDSAYFPVQECFCEEGNFCAYIDTCNNDLFTLILYNFNNDDNYKCHDSHEYETLDIPTNQCNTDSGEMYYCSNPDTHDDDSDDNDNTQNLYDYIERKEYRNDICNGNPRSSEKYEINECKCNNEEGWCVYPLYCNNEFIEVELYMGSSCNRNNFQEILKFEPNTCFDQQEFTCHHDDEIHPIVALAIGIASTLFCCFILVILFRCCCVQRPCPMINHIGRSAPVQQPPQVQMVQQPQGQVPQIMVQQPQGQVPQIMVQQPQGPMQYAVQQPVYQVSAPKQQIIGNAPPGENVPPAYSTSSYPPLN